MANQKQQKNQIANTILGILLILFMARTITEQLRRSPQDRTWHGSIARIPYDFRLPTAERLRHLLGQ